MSSLVDNQTASFPWVTSPENWLSNHNQHGSFAQELLKEFAFLNAQREGYAKLGNEVPAHLKMLVVTSIKPVEALLKAMNAGFELCTPPDWRCGWFDKSPSSVKETFPRVTGSPSSIQQFVGLVPANALEKWVIAKPIFSTENIRVYSPHKADFKSVPKVVYHDPIMIGRIMHNGEAKYFRIAQWDLAKDLAAHN